MEFPTRIASIVSIFIAASQILNRNPNRITNGSAHSGISAGNKFTIKSKKSIQRWEFQTRFLSSSFQLFISIYFLKSIFFLRDFSIHRSYIQKGVLINLKLIKKVCRWQTISLDNRGYFFFSKFRIIVNDSLNEVANKLRRFSDFCLRATHKRQGQHFQRRNLLFSLSNELS